MKNLKTFNMREFSLKVTDETNPSDKLFLGASILRYQQSNLKGKI